jgi:hypothetical protein
VDCASLKGSRGLNMRRPASYDQMKVAVDGSLSLVRPMLATLDDLPAQPGQVVSEVLLAPMKPR